MVKYLPYLCILPVARHRVLGIAVARLHRGPGKTPMAPIECQGSV